MIVVLRPNASFPLLQPAPTDREVSGDILSVEKGVVPYRTVHRRDSFVTSLEAGVPRKLFLKALPDGQGHYIIGNFPEWYGDRR